ncbi:MAG: AAA family ATPase [Alphaproteobacteria bacterium]
MPVPSKNSTSQSVDFKHAASPLDAADIKVSVKQVFGLDSDWLVPAFSKNSPYVPDIDEAYVFDHDTTHAILAGFAHNRRVMIQGYHGTGKSTHIEQVAARLNWPCVRVNLDSHISRMDLIGKDAITIKDGKQITEFRMGILPWALQGPVALCFDEYDVGRPDVMFVIQRVLEQGGKLTLLDQSQVIRPHPFFRLFATANTIGLGDSSGLYHGTNPINQGQMDRWSILAVLNYLPPEKERAIVLSKCQSMDNEKGRVQIASMVRLAEFSRTGFIAGDISTVMSPRSVISWAENALLFNDIALSFRLSFLNRCDETERPIIAEYFQKAFGIDIKTSIMPAGQISGEA